MFVYQIGIRPSATSESWEIDPNNITNNLNEVCDLGDLLSNLSEFYLLGSDELPDGIEDIRGNIHDEPSRVFAVCQPWGVEYFGIEDANA